MKLTVLRWFDQEDYRARLMIKWLSKTISFLDWESEDANLWRDFKDCYAIARLIKEANELWLKWESIEIEEIKDDDIFSDQWE